MTDRSARLDPDLCLAALPPEDRACIARWEETFALAWVEVPPLRLAVETVAVLRVSTDMPDELSECDRIRRAAERLGLTDDDERKSHPGGRFIRNLSNWRNAGGDVFPADYRSTSALS